MRKNKTGEKKNGYTLMILDDDQNILDALRANFRSMGYEVETQSNPLRALEQLKIRHYDILLLDFIMSPICGDEVVARLREFDRKIFVIMLTGHKELAPPLNTIRELDIQGYCEKSDRYDQLELLVESCVKSIQHMNTIYRYKEGLSQILSSIPPMHKMLPIEEIAQGILEELAELSGCKDVFVWIKPDNVLTDIELLDLPENIFQGKGCYDKDFEEIAKEKYEGDIAAIYESIERGQIIADDRRLMIPLSDRKEVVLGILGISKPGEKDPTLMELLSVYAEQVSAALHNNLLRLLINANNKCLSEANLKIQNSYMQTVEALRLLVDAKDLYTRGHSDRVSRYSVELAKELGRSQEFITQVRVAGLLHDIGKIGVSDAILCKPDKLTEEEYASIKKHPGVGEEILSCMTMFDNLGAIVCAHHERYDGAGYPKGLKGKDIPEEARILCIADAFDAMMSDRHYRKRLPFEDCIRQLKEGRGTQFDGELVEEFLKVLERYDAISEELQWTYV